MIALFLALVGVLLAGLVLSAAAWSYTTQPRYKRRREVESLPEIDSPTRRILRTN